MKAIEALIVGVTGGIAGALASSYIGSAVAAPQAPTHISNLIVDLLTVQKKLIVTSSDSEPLLLQDGLSYMKVSHGTDSTAAGRPTHPGFFMLQIGSNPEGTTAQLQGGVLTLAQNPPGGVASSSLFSTDVIDLKTASGFHARLDSLGLNVGMGAAQCVFTYKGQECLTKSP